jgi:hypothetical protein
MSESKEDFNSLKLELGLTQKDNEFFFTRVI